MMNPKTYLGSAAPNPRFCSSLVSCYSKLRLMFLRIKSKPYRDTLFLIVTSSSTRYSFHLKKKFIVFWFKKTPILCSWSGRLLKQSEHRSLVVVLESMMMLRLRSGWKGQFSNNISIFYRNFIQNPLIALKMNNSRSKLFQRSF